MDETLINKNTKWECVRCGKCCKGIIISKEKNLSIIKDGKPICKFLDGTNCLDYSSRPFICQLYPFIIDVDKILDSNGTARPHNAFLLENLKIHTDCCGYGKGKRIYANKNLHKKLEKLSYEFQLNFKDAFEKKKNITL